jgi:hypothetical protein
VTIVASLIEALHGDEPGEEKLKRAIPSLLSSVELAGELRGSKAMEDPQVAALVNQLFALAAEGLNIERKLNARLKEINHVA